MPIALRDIVVPAFVVPIEAPRIPAALYEKRCRDAYARAECDWLVVYADREHLANIAFLSGYDPRFEEALLLLGPRDKRVLLVGNEGEPYSPLAVLPGLEIALAQSLSLMGQDRSLKPDLAAVLREAGLTRGQTIGLVGWKYFDPAEWDDASPALFVPHYLVAMLAKITGGLWALQDATFVLMHLATGLRSTIDADQIALHEWGAARASAAVWRIVTGTQLGLSELEAASRMGYAGEALTAHVMYATGDSDHPVIGLRSPGGRIVSRGDGVTAGVGYWGGLSARAGLIADSDEAFLKTAAAYFGGLIAWYEATDIGASGKEVFAAVAEALARGGLRSALNPGHLTGHDEWVHTPIRPGSDERIASGMPFQVDIIPTPLRTGWALNCEDSVVFADAALRAELKARHPAVVERIEARRRFVRDELGIPIRDSILPLSSTPLCLPPFWLASGRLLAQA
jgi:hypothetical protein